MARDIESEIKLHKPDFCSEELVFLNLIRTADLLGRQFAEFMKMSDLSPTQFNVLRILGEAGKDGLACGAISERMVTKDPDITRLLDRLEKRGMVTRTREKGDRRVVIARITQSGLDLLKKLHDPVVQLIKSMLGHISPKQQEALMRLLELAREKT